MFEAIVIVIFLILAYRWWMKNNGENFYPGFSVDKGNSYYDPVSGQRVFPKN